MKNFLLIFLIIPLLAFAGRSQNFDADNYNFGQTGNLTKQELYRLQGVTSNVQGQLDSKEAISNKATNLTAPDNTKYPTTQAVSTGLSAGLATKEDTANKATSLASPDNVKFPTTQAVSTGLATKQDTITGAASTITTSNLGTSKAMVTDGSGKAAASSTVDTTELGYLDGVTSAIQTQINTNATNISGKVTGPASATDEAVARYDATTGKLIQDSKVTINDNGLLTTLGTATAGIYNQGKDYIAIWGDGSATTGSNATLDVTNSGAAIAVSNSSLVSISNISPFPTGGEARRFTLVNNTGNSITIVNDPTTSTATTGIYTGTGQDITIGNKASVTFIWNSTRWSVMGGSGSGSGGGPSDLDIAFSQDFESAKLTDFTQTGLTIDALSVMHLKKSALLTHNASVIQSFKQVIALDPKFRSKNLSLKVDCKSTATSGNVTVTVYDETNATTLLSSTQLACSTAIDSYYASFDTASTTASISYTVSALMQSGSPVTYVDDIVAYITKSSALTSSFTYKEATIVETESASCTFASTAWQGLGNVTSNLKCKRKGDSIVISGQATIGVVSGSQAQFLLPTWSGSQLLTANSARVGSTSGASHIGGRISRAVSSGTTDYTAILAASQPYFNVGYHGSIGGAVNPGVPQNGNGAFGSSEVLIFENVTIPIEGWTESTTTNVTKTIPLTKSAFVQEADTKIELNTYAGFGSTGTKIPRFSLQTSPIQGDALAYQDSSTLGASFTATKDTYCTFTYGMRSAISNRSHLGLSRNATLADTALNIDAGGLSSQNVRIATALSVVVTSETAMATATWTGPLKSGDVIRPHNGSGPNVPSFAGDAYFNAACQGSLKQVNVNKNSKITIPTSELRLEGSSARGTAPQGAIVVYNTIAKLTGDAFDINPSGSAATYGTHVKMKKSGKLDVSASLLISGKVSVTKNQTDLNSSTIPAPEAMCTDYGTGEIGSASCSFNVSVNDVIRVSSEAIPTSNVANAFTLYFQEQDIQVSVSNTLPQYSETDISLRAAGNSGQAITASVTDIPFTIVSDTHSAWNGSQYVVPKTGTYHISGHVLYSTSSSRWQDLYVNGSLYKRLGEAGVSTTNFHLGITDTFTAGQVLSVRDGVGGTLSNSGNFHWLNITLIGKPNASVDVTPFVTVPTIDRQTAYVSSTTSFTNTTIKGMSASTTGSGVFSYNSTTGVYTVLKKAKFELSYSAQSNTAGIMFNYIASGDITAGGSGMALDTAASSGQWTSATITKEFQAGETFSFYVSGTTNFIIYSIVADAVVDSLAAPTENFSTDTATLVFKSSAVTSTDPVGTFSTKFFNTTVSATQTQSTTAPTQTVDSMKVDGIRVFGRPWQGTSTAASPALVQIQIGKYMKGVSVQAYSSAGKASGTEINYDFSSNGGSTDIGTIVGYNEQTGILTLDASVALANNTTRAVGWRANGSSNTALDGYFVINASKTPTLSGISYVAPRVAYMKSVQAAGAGDGASIVGYQTRKLNTLDDASGIIQNPTSFTGTGGTNTQFQLASGEYNIDACAPAYVAERHNIRLRNVTSSTTVIVGSTERNTGGTVTQSCLSGRFTVTSASTFEIQHYIASASSPLGLGLETASGDVGVFTQVTLTKVK